jgi:hypothetical protein
MDKELNADKDAKAEIKAGRRVLRIIGYDAAESHRASHIVGDNRYRYVYPLIEWQWDRNDCLAALKRHGFPAWCKSACYYCPSSKIHEILALPKDLQDKAIEMERRALASGKLGVVKGLGRHWSWEDVIRNGGRGAKDGSLQSEPCINCDDGGGCSIDELDIFAPSGAEGKTT